MITNEQIFARQIVFVKYFRALRHVGMLGVYDDTWSIDKNKIAQIIQMWKD